LIAPLKETTTERRADKNKRVFYKCEFVNTMENINPTNKKRKSFSAEKKLEILRELDASTIKAIAEQYSVDIRTIKKWKAERAELEKLQNTDLFKKLKRRKSPLDELNEAVYIWFRTTLNNGINLSGPLIKGNHF